MYKSNYRFYIQIRKSLGLKLNEIFQELKASKRSKAPSFSTVKRWYGRFIRWENRLEAETRS